MSKQYHFITEGKGKEEARNNVKSWLFDFLGREFYDGYEVSDTDIKRVCEFDPDFFDKLLSTAEELIPAYKDSISRYEKEGDRFMAGYDYERLGEILMCSFCLDMPFWNLLTGDWSLPNPNDWAVAVVLE